MALNHLDSKELSTFKNISGLELNGITSLGLSNTTSGGIPVGSDETLGWSKSRFSINQCITLGWFTR